MWLELVKELSLIDSNLSLCLNLSKDKIYTISVDGMEVGGYIYSYSSPDIKDCIDKIYNFIECLKDTDKFIKLVDNILNEPLEV